MATSCLNYSAWISFTDYKTFSIDAAHNGNWARFMNHAEETSSKNNAIPWEHYLEEGPRIVFTSGARGIKKGEQILYSYGDEYWNEKKCVIL